MQDVESSDRLLRPSADSNTPPVAFLALHCHPVLFKDTMLASRLSLFGDRRPSKFVQPVEIASDVTARFASRPL